MKLSVAIASTLLSVSGLALGQVVISSPQPGATLIPGQSVTVEVDMKPTTVFFTNIAIAIGFKSCVDVPGICSSAADLGQIFYAGSFTPETHEPTKPPYQNFTFALPSAFTPGSAQLTLATFDSVTGGDVNLGFSIIPFNAS